MRKSGKPDLRAAPQDEGEEDNPSPDSLGVDPGLFISAKSLRVLPGLAPGIHVGSTQRRRVDGRDEPGHDG
jgi:hypothetical protein